MSFFTSTPIRMTFALLLSALFVSACSSSSSAPTAAGDSQTIIEVVASSDSADISVDNGIMSDVAVLSDNSTDGQTDGPTDSSTGGLISGAADDSAGGVALNPAASATAVPDPLTQNSTRVVFEITVPVYVSNALQVRIVWDDKNIAAKWVGDELWSVSDDFPTDTQHALSVTFYDDNGGVTLGRFEQNFKTGTNAAESFQITANQFGTDQWDDDNDGASNLHELIAGTDPAVDNTMQLVVRADFERPSALSVLAEFSKGFETLIPAERPFFEHTESHQPFILEPYTTEVTKGFTIDLDEAGTGMYSDTYRSWEHTNTHIENNVATRTNTGDSISWVGIVKFSDSSAGLSWDISFDSVTKVVNENTRSQTGVVDREKSGDWGGGNGKVNVSYSLVGEVQEGSQWCNAVSGTVTYSGWHGEAEARVAAETTLSKAINDLDWTVIVASLDGLELEEFLVSSIAISFYCAFADL